jgi:hypothetical protein
MTEKAAHGIRSRFSKSKPFVFRVKNDGAGNTKKPVIPGKIKK